MELTLEQLKEVVMLLDKLNVVGKMLEMVDASDDASDDGVEFSLGLSNQEDDFESLELSSTFGVEILDRIRNAIVKDLEIIGITISED